MTEARGVRVDLGERGYTIDIEPGSIRSWGRRLKGAGIGGRLFVVSNPTVHGLHGEALAQGLRPEFGEVEIILIPDGERYKSLATANDVYTRLIELGAVRSDTIAGFGGGVVGDLAGFVAATYLRGVRLVLLPTTLVAQTDSSVGGKVGVNHALGKNLIGAFYQPRAVLTDPLLLRTLPPRELHAGLFEVIKYGFIRDEAVLSRVESMAARLPDFDASAMTELVARSSEIKAAVVAADERETDLRRILNFGHTVGHALETAGGYTRFLHGEAVGWGMLAALWLSSAVGLSDDAPLRRYEALLARLAPLPDTAGLDIAGLASIMGRDKKMASDGLHFVLVSGIGAPVIRSDVPARLTAEALRYVLEASKPGGTE